MPLLPSRPGFLGSCLSAGPALTPPWPLRTGAPQAGTAGLWLVPVAAWGDKLGEGLACQGVAIRLTSHPETQPSVQLLPPPACLLTQLNTVLMSFLFKSQPAPSSLRPSSPCPSSQVPAFILNTLSPLTQPSYPPSPPSGFREPKAQ